MTTLDALQPVSTLALVALTVWVDENAYPHGQWTPNTTQIMLTLTIAMLTAWLTLTALTIARIAP